MPREDKLREEFHRLPPEARRAERRLVPMVIVDHRRVLPSLDERAQRALRYAREELPLTGPVLIRWLIPQSETETGPVIMAPVGRDAYTEPLTHPYEIFLSAGTRDPVGGVLHEARHLWQANRPKGRLILSSLTPDDEDMLEEDAWVWERMHKGRV